jgi:hypothetical protein
MPLRALLAASAALVLTVLALATPVQASPGLFVKVTRLDATTARVVAICPNDPPDTLFLTGTLPGDTSPTLLGSTPVTCTGSRLYFNLPLSVTLTPGTTITNTTVTVSGDGGEVNGFDNSIKVHP